jgi:hypothetical protein
MGLVYSCLFFSLRMYGAVGALQASHRLLCAPDLDGDGGESQTERVRVLKQWAVLSALGIWESLGDPLLSWLPFYTTVKLLLFLSVVAPGASMAPWVFDRMLRPGAEEAWQRVGQRVQPMAARAIENGALVMEVLGADEEGAQEIKRLLTARKRSRAEAAAAAAAATGGGETPSGGSSGAAARPPEDDARVAAALVEALEEPRAELQEGGEGEEVGQEQQACALAQGKAAPQQGLQDGLRLRAGRAGL